MISEHNNNTIELDARGQVLGRLSVKIALLLQGKDFVDYAPNRFPFDRKIIVLNPDKIKISGKKADNKKYYHYSGYPGGLRTRNYKELFEREPALVLRKSVWGMLPKNKLRKQMLKNLCFKNNPDNKR